jgi:hypothetical protein
MARATALDGKDGRIKGVCQITDSFTEGQSYVAFTFFIGVDGVLPTGFFVVWLVSFAANSCFTLRAIASVFTLYLLAASRRTGRIDARGDKQDRHL